MLLTELFKTDVNLNWRGKGFAEFDPGDGSLVHISLEHIKFSNGLYWMTFDRSAPDGEFSMKITNQGYQFNIFSGVRKFLDTSLNWRDIKWIYFSADRNEPSRIKLYDRMIHLFPSSFSYVDLEDIREINSLPNDIKTIIVDDRELGMKFYLFKRNH